MKLHVDTSFSLDDVSFFCVFWSCKRQYHYIFFINILFLFFFFFFFKSLLIKKNTIGGGGSKQRPITLRTNILTKKINKKRPPNSQITFLAMEWFEHLIQFGSGRHKNTHPKTALLVYCIAVTT
jgi:hypothetical protein